MTTPSERFKSNLEMASKLKLEASHWFSPVHADYVRHVSSYEQMDPECLCIALMNIVAATSRNSYINRGSHFKIPLNIYNIVVARSGYGKSAVLDVAERGMKAAAAFFPSDFAENPTVDEFENERKATIDTINDKSKLSNRIMTHKIPRIVYHDGSAAGILNKLKQCTRTLSFHEADVSLLKNLNVFMSSPFDRSVSGKIDPFRSTLMQLYDNPNEFTRQLKNEEVATTGAKLNIMGASTGDLFINQLVRQSSSSSADALFERMIYWPLDGVPIPDEACLLEIDFDRYPSIEQFSVICGYLADLSVAVGKDAEQLLSSWSFDMRLAGNQERNNDHLASRLSKSSNVLYRLSGFIAILEAAFMIAQDYLLNHHSFVDGVMTKPMFGELLVTANKLYGGSAASTSQYTITVSKECAQRAYDITIANIEQYKLLMNLTTDDVANWSIHKYSWGRIGSKVKNTSIGLPHALPVVPHAPEPKTKTNQLKVKILIHDSLIFIKSGLYVDRELKNASKILDNILLHELVEEGLLHRIKPGIIGKYNKPPLFIKALPVSEDEVPAFVRRLSEFGDNRLSFESYMAKCTKIVVHAKGIVTPSVFAIINRAEYQALNLDYSCLNELKCDEEINDAHSSSSLNSQITQEEMCTDPPAEETHTLRQTTQSDGNEIHATIALNVEDDINVLRTNEEPASNIMITQAMLQSVDTEQNNINSRHNLAQNASDSNGTPVLQNVQIGIEKKEKSPEKTSRRGQLKRKKNVENDRAKRDEYHDPISTRVRSR